MNETQYTINNWAEETFGPTHPYDVTKRMMTEVKELIGGFENTTSNKDKTALGNRWAKTEQRRILIPINEIPNDELDELREECADIAIMLDQVAELLQVNIQDIKNHKMKINRGRRWGYCPDKRQVRHITDFVEEGTGITMKIDHWYVLDDTCCCYCPKGFLSAEAALAWIQAPEQCVDYGHSPDCAGIPDWDPDINCWRDDGGEGGDGFAINVMYGRDLYDFWQNHRKPVGKELKNDRAY